MKKLLIIGIMAATLLSSSVMSFACDGQYPSTVVVKDTIHINGTVNQINAIDFNGNQVSFIDLDGEYKIGDICSLTMNENGTPGYIEDDYIECIRYSGWIDGNWGWNGSEPIIKTDEKSSWKQKIVNALKNRY